MGALPLEGSKDMLTDDGTDRSSGEHSNPRHATKLAGLLRSTMLVVVVAAGLDVHSANATKHVPQEPFKVAKIYFETNASACDMGIQIVFDTEGIKYAEFKNPGGEIIHTVSARNGLFGIGGQTEGFLESVEPVIRELRDTTECEADPEEPVISLSRLRHLFPPGRYEFFGAAKDGTKFRDAAKLTYCIPNGPVLGKPDGLDDQPAGQPITINWERVTQTIPGVPNGCRQPLSIIGYQVLVYDANAGEAPQEFNVTVPGDQTSVDVPSQFLKPGTEYNIEVLAIEASGNQTITEGSFSTKQ